MDDADQPSFMTLEPRERLDFRRPFNTVVKTALTVKNVENEPIGNYQKKPRETRGLIASTGAQRRPRIV
jgi:hypothetical protein